MFLIELLLMSLGILAVLIGSVGGVILAALFIITLCVKISEWSDSHGCWVEWLALLGLLWMAAFALSVCLQI